MKYIKIILVLFLGTLTSCLEPKLDLSDSNLPEVVSPEMPKKVCKETPTESAGSYPIKSPKSLIRTDIADGVVGVKLTVNLIINKGGQVLENAKVAIWHCDPEGNYSQYGANASETFLRGQQITDEGKVSFQTIFPGWQEDRAGHIYVSVKSADDISLKITQIAFPQKTQEEVFNTSNYTGLVVKNAGDRVFKDSLDCNLPEEITGNVNDGYVLTKEINIK